VLVLQTLYTLSDDQAEYQMRDRLSFMRFLGLALKDRGPDAKTIRPFRKQLTRAVAIERLFLALRSGAARRQVPGDRRSDYGVIQAVRPDSNHLVVGITQRGERLLKNAGRWREHHPKTKNKEWKHDFMRSTIIASIAIAAKANGCTFTYPDEVVAEMDGRLSFDVPPYEYRMEKNNELRTMEDALIRPDGFFALTYENGTKRIFIVEADCDTEPDRSDNTERKSHKHNILAYDALISDGDLRRTYFGEARVGVLNVFSVLRAMKTAMEVHEEEIGHRGKYMLYQSWVAFGDYFRPPPPRPSLFLNSWQRVGQPATFISKAPEEEPQHLPSPFLPTGNLSELAKA
jgi:transposase-like protein DUF772